MLRFQNGVEQRVEQSCHVMLEQLEWYAKAALQPALQRITIFGRVMDHHSWTPSSTQQLESSQVFVFL